MIKEITVDEIIEKLKLEPLPIEGGMFKSTYHSEEKTGNKEMCNAIYYLLKRGAFSHLHKLPNDEIYHHYMGDPLEMLELCPDGTANRRILGNNVLDGEEPQIVMHKGCFQGSRPLATGKYGYTLVGCTNSPGYTDKGYEHLTDVNWALETYPDFEELIKALTN
ncbi:MAG: cupin domain-containing protein [Lachnospiraceae bacterium]|nr:cupin domain-containing protein [Lachnospiraceae bacterium]